jgi:hypothetical protein
MLDPRGIYYVYLLFDWLGIPRYVGKGKKRRAYTHITKSDSINWLKNEFIEQTWIMLGDIPIIFVREDFTEVEAFEVERTLIQTIGRMIKGTGPLTNITEGGEGVSGLKHSKSTGKAISTGLQIYWNNLSDKERTVRIDLGRQGIHRAHTAEERSTRMKQAMSKLTPEQLSDRSRRAWQTKTPEERRAIRQKAYAKLTLEQRKARGQKALLHIDVAARGRSISATLQKLTPEERKRRMKHVSASVTLEGRKRGHAKRDPEEKRELGRKMNLNRTRESRQEAARKSWITRRRNQENPSI